MTDPRTGREGAPSRPDVDVERTLAAARRGDRAAQQSLLLQQIGRIRGRVARLVGAGGDEADDLVQQACVELLRSLARYRGDASLALWVDRVTTHVVLKHFRGTTRRLRRVSLTPDVDRCGELDAERRLAWREGVEAARAVVDRLKPDQRIVFLLVAVEGHTLGEAAAILDLGLPATKSRYLRARRQVEQHVRGVPQLRELLDREEGP